METTADQVEPLAVPTYFDATLYPHRSMGRGGQKIVARLLILPGLFVGVLSYVYSVWFIFAFYVLHTSVLYAMIRYHWFVGQAHERVRILGDEVVIEQVPAFGPKRTLKFQAQWVQVSYPDKPSREAHLMIGSHGNTAEIGGFLLPDEKKDFAQSLRRGLRARVDDMINRDDL